jgi:hypothetical protein
MGAIVSAAHAMPGPPEAYWLEREASEANREQLRQYLLAELGLTSQQLSGHAKFANWPLRRFAAEMVEPGWQDRFRAELAQRLVATEQRIVDAVLQTGPKAMGSLSLEAIHALLKRPVLRALASSYHPEVHGGRLILGPTGVGKTISAVAAARLEAKRIALRRLDYTAGAYADANDVVEFMPRALLNPFGDAIGWARALELPLARLGHGLGEGEAELVTMASTTQFLLLDDLGWESKRAGADDVIAEVVARRYDSGLITLATSGLTLEGIEARYGDAFWRRIVESRNLPGKVLDLHDKEARH